MKTKKFKDRCPKCKSEDLEFDSIEPEGDQIFQRVSCKNCGLDFKIWTKTDWEYEEEKGKG